jgi:ribosomal protein S18 acetylase RimI-like enzyme
MDIELVSGLDVPFDDGLSALCWDTDPELFAFLFMNDKDLWSRLFKVEWHAKFGIYNANEIMLALADNRVVGMLSCFPGSTMAPRFDAVFTRFAAALDETTWSRVERGFEQMGWLFPPVPDDAFFVYALEVVPEARGKHVGRMLLQHAEIGARQNGLKRIHLDTAANRPAVGFYRKLGYEPLVETRLCRLRDGETVPNHFRMVKDI